MTVHEELPETEAPHFRKTLRRVDIIFLSISAVISIDAIAQIAATGGAQSFLWALAIAVTFMLPYGFVIAELGSSFRQEGGPYVWSRLAFGKLAAAVSTMLYWITNPLWMGGSLAFIAAAAWETYVIPVKPGSPGDFAFKILFIWLAIASAIIGLQYGKFIVMAGAIVKVGLVAFFVITVAAYAAQHGVHGSLSSGFSPTISGFLAVTPILLFGFVGFEAPNGAAEEMRNPRRDVPRAIGFSGTVAVLSYVVPIFAILAVLPTDKIHGATGFLDAVRVVFSVYGDASAPMLVVAALLFVFSAFTQASSWMISSDRVQAAASMDNAFIPFFGKFSKRLGTPVRMNLLSGVAATIFCVAATVLVKGSAAAVFTVVLTIAITTLLLSYLIIFPTIIVLRRKFPDTDRPYRVPGGKIGLWVCTVLIYAWVLLGSWVAVFPGVLEGVFGIKYDFLETWGVTRGTFETFTIGTIIVIVLFALGGYLWGSITDSKGGALPGASDPIPTARK